MSSTRINSSTGDDVQFMQASDNNGANISSIPDTTKPTVNDSRQLSAEQVAKYREILLNMIPLSRLRTLISCANGDPVAVSPATKRANSKKRKLEYDDEDPIANNVEVTPLPVHEATTITQFER